MRTVCELTLIGSTAEEQLPNFSRDYPCITTRAELWRYPNALLPWHWHPAIELFTVLSGAVDYHIPGHTIHVGRGQGGLLLPDILHRSSWEPTVDAVVLVHLFDPTFLFGDSENRMAKKYMAGILNDAGRSFLFIDPANAQLHGISETLEASFRLDESQERYEYALRDHLCRIWLDILMVPAELWTASMTEHSNVELRQIISYIQTHLVEEVKIDKLAEQAHISVRSCYRLFRDIMHTTPIEYIQSARIRRACQLLVDTDMSVTDIAYSTGFCSLSYFSRIFRRFAGSSPSEYRDWHDRTNP